MVSRLAMAVLICAVTAAAAQEQRGSIEGVIRDSSGAVVPGVTVEARGTSLVGAASTVTGSDGVYRFPALPPGTYEISASLQGFSPARAQNVVLELGQL